VPHSFIWVFGCHTELVKYFDILSELNNFL
jgi:hypothetical protein